MVTFSHIVTISKIIIEVVQNFDIINFSFKVKKITWPQSTSELYRPSDCRLSAKLVPTFIFYADRGCHVVSVTNPYGRILGFLDWSRYYFFQVAPQLYSQG
jgi:hypothetical protein